MDKEKYKEYRKSQYERWGVPLPKEFKHGDDFRELDVEELKKKSTKMLPKEWKQKGNVIYGLVGGAEVGFYIPTDYILEGKDKDGLPKLKKVVV